MLSILRYVERNPLRAGMVVSGDAWPWSSLSRRAQQTPGLGPPLTPPPHGIPEDWLAWVNRPQSDKELAALQMCMQRGSPLGQEQWVKDIAAQLGLDSTLRPKGRPRKEQNKCT